MIIELDKGKFRQFFRKDPHPFISLPFLEINSRKVDELVFLVNDANNSLGLSAGIKDGKLLSPFSAPMGGFHFRNEKVLYSHILEFLTDLKKYIKSKKISTFHLTLPPDVYCSSINAKVVNALVRSGFKMLTPDITSIGDLYKFSGQFSDRKTRKNYKQAVSNGLHFSEAKTNEEKKRAYDTIYENRRWLKRPMSLSFEEILKIEKLWPVIFFNVYSKSGEDLSAAILYQGHNKIIQIVWWGDNPEGRSLRAMDFMALNLWNYFKELGFHYIDIGISTEKGITNAGLLRFKESLDAHSFLRFSFTWETE